MQFLAPSMSAPRVSLICSLSWLFLMHMTHHPTTSSSSSTVEGFTFAFTSTRAVPGSVPSSNRFTTATATATASTTQRLTSTTGTHTALNAGPPSASENEGGTYRPFAAYAWEKLISSGLVQESSAPVPSHLASNSSPAKGSPPGSTVNIEVKAAATATATTTNAISQSACSSPLRMARYALLETLTPKQEDSSSSDEFISAPNGIHVLNLVLFPNVALALPVLGMDLVTLPGGKNLIAIDFQPILAPPLVHDDESSDNNTQEPPPPPPLFPPQYAKYEKRIQQLHQKHVLNQSEILPWGGDIPPKAQRFFSPYALWTRIQGEGVLNTIQNEVFDAFRDYFDLYLEIMMEVSVSASVSESVVAGDSIASITSTSTSSSGQEEVAGMESSIDLLGDIKDGHRDYLNYRRANDPARPMLTRLYGEDYTEEVIAKVLFEMI